MATEEGLEPPRSPARIKIWCVYQFRHSAIWTQKLDSNQRPLGYEPSKLPTAPFWNIKSKD